MHGKCLTILSFAAISTLALQCSPRYPTILIDEAHYQVERPGKATAAPYEIAPASGLVIDTTRFTFLPDADLKIQKPNLMQLVVSKDEIYAADFDGNSYRHTLDSTTLQPMQDGLKFTGFKSGQDMILAIGNVKIAKEEPGPEGLRVMWVGLIKVTENKK
ncbi:MAG: hypothetical protein JNM27_03500 [Leptospirales bacterium]|nr:hypothetical protein [Leptospirales bacterium]